MVLQSGWLQSLNQCDAFARQRRFFFDGVHDRRCNDEARIAVGQRGIRFVDDHGIEEVAVEIVDDIGRGLHAEFASRGVPVGDLRVTFYGMKEFEVRDPDDYWLWFGQPTDEAPTVREGD